MKFERLAYGTLWALYFVFFTIVWLAFTSCQVSRSEKAQRALRRVQSKYPELVNETNDSTANNVSVAGVSDSTTIGLDEILSIGEGEEVADISPTITNDARNKEEPKKKNGKKGIYKKGPNGTNYTITTDGNNVNIHSISPGKDTVVYDKTKKIVVQAGPPRPGFFARACKTYQTFSAYFLAVTVVLVFVCLIFGFRRKRQE